MNKRTYEIPQAQIILFAPAENIMSQQNPGLIWDAFKSETASITGVTVETDSWKSELDFYNDKSTYKLP